MTIIMDSSARFGVDFKAAFKNPSFSTVVKRLLERVNMDNLTAACQELSEDQVAQGFLTRVALTIAGPRHPGEGG